jgi:hypothetical protein
LLNDQLTRYLAETEGILTASERELTLGYEQGRVDLRDLQQVRSQGATLRVDAATLREQLALALIALQTAAATHPAILKPYLKTTNP